MKRTPLRLVSKRRIERTSEYLLKLRIYLEYHPICEVCNKKKSNQIHHKKGRIGVRLTDDTYFCSVCATCHYKIHKNPKWARSNGLMLDRLAK